MNKWLFRGLTAAMACAAVLIWGQILLAKKEVEQAHGPYGPPLPGAYSFPANYVICSPDYVAAVVSVRGSNRYTCAPMNREQ